MDILINLVQFTAVPVGVPTALPHFLNIDDIGIVPDRAEVNNDDFIVLSADATNVTVRNDGAAPGNCTVWVERKHSITRSIPPLSTPLFPFIPEGSGGTSTSASSNCLVFRPGSGLAGPVVFDTWPALIAQLTALRAASNGSGCYVIEFDDSIVSPAVVPAGGPYDMTSVSWIGIVDAVVNVSVADGASLTNLRSIRNNLVITNLNTVTPADVSLVNNDVISIDLNSAVDTIAGGAPFWSGTGLTAGQGVIVFLNRVSGLDFVGTGPVVDLPVAGTFLFILAGVSSSLPATTTTALTGAAGTILVPATQTMKGAPDSFPGWLGVVLDTRLDEPGTLRPNPYLVAPSTTSVTAAFDQWLRFDASGGAIAQTLPAISTASGGFSRPGGYIFVTEHGAGATTVSLSPAGGDTVDGGAGPFAVPAGGGVILSSDGISDWKVVAVFDPSLLPWNVTGPFTSAGAPHAVLINDLAQADMSAGAFAFTLPAISAINSGQEISFKNVAGGGTAFTLTPAGADTIDGAASLSVGGALSSVTIASDGVSNWIVR